MLLATLALLAMARPPDPELHPPVKAGIEAMYGKELDARGLCSRYAQLPDTLPQNIHAGGVRRGARGCVLQGLTIGDDWVAPEVGLRQADKQLGSYKADRREKAVRKWVRHVLLAFDEVDGDITSVTRGDEVVVTAPFWQRTDDRNVMRFTRGTFRFSKDGVLLGSDRDDGQDWRTSFYVRPDRPGKASLSDEVVSAALNSQGKAIERCFLNAQDQRATLEGGMKVRIVVEGGEISKVVRIAKRGEDDPLLDSLSQCYSRVVRRAAFPEDASGETEWVFAGVREEQ